MTEKEFSNRRTEMDDKILIRLCEKAISDLSKTNGHSFRMCIPPMVTDTDMILSELVKRFKEKSEQLNYIYEIGKDE